MTAKTVSAIAKNVNASAKGATVKAAPAAAKAKGTATPAATVKAKVNPLVELHLPKGTERFTSASGIDWVRTPKQGAFQRWFQMAPKGTAETGIHGIKGDAKSGFVLTIERARVPYRELREAIKEIK